MTLEILTSDLLAPLRHGFFTRRGGASSGIFAGLNCGRGSSDLDEAVALNRRRVAEAMQSTPEQLVSVRQVHSARVLSVTAPLPEPRPEADGIVTATPGLVLTVLTADCQPVLMADKEAGVIGIAHAGWRGMLDGVLEATLEAMGALGAEPARTCAVIGPTISQRNYEVGPDLMERFCDDDPSAARFFAQGRGDRLLFDLPGMGLDRLRRAGVGASEWTRHCTYADPARFYSYRRATHSGEVDYGRLLSAIRL